MNYKKVIKNIRQELSNYIQENKLQSLVIGISGGIDSALCAALAKPVCDELQINLCGVSLPTSTNEKFEQLRARAILTYFCSDYQIYYINNIFKNVSQNINFNYHTDELNYKIRNGNIKARLRMIYLYNIASMNNGLVLSTDNWTEYLLGFWSLHGDVGDYGMIQELWKTEVYETAEWLVKNELTSEKSKALSDCIDCLATDGLGVSDLGDLGQILPEWWGTSREGYKEVDRVLQIWTTRDKLEPLQMKTIEASYIKHPVIQRHLKTEFKRKVPINIKRNLIIE